MTKQVFYIPYICALIQQVGGKTVPETVYAYFLADAGFMPGIAEYLLNSPGRIRCLGLLRFKQVFFGPWFYFP